MEKRIIRENKAYLVEIENAEQEDGTVVEIVTSKKEISVEELESRNTSIDADIVSYQAKITEAEAEKTAIQALIDELNAK